MSVRPVAGLIPDVVYQRPSSSGMKYGAAPRGVGCVVAAVAGGELDDRAGARDVDRAVEPVHGLAVRVGDAVRRGQVAPRGVETEARRAPRRCVVGVVVLGVGLAAPAEVISRIGLPFAVCCGVDGPVDVADVGVVGRLRGRRGRGQLAVEHAVGLARVAHVQVDVERDAVHVRHGPGRLRLPDAVTARADRAADVRAVAVVEQLVVEPGRRRGVAALGVDREVPVADRVVRVAAAVLAHVAREHAGVDHPDVLAVGGVAGGVGELRPDRQHAVVSQELRSSPARRIAEPTGIAVVGLDRRRWYGQLRRRRLHPSTQRQQRCDQHRVNARPSGQGSPPPQIVERGLYLRTTRAECGGCRRTCRPGRRRS